MKLFIALALALTASAPAFAAPAEAPCTKFMPCGTFESTPEEGVKITVVISPVSANKVKFDFTQTEVGKDPMEWKLNVHFKRNGQFVMTTRTHGDLYAAGVCIPSRCTYGMMPFSYENKPINNAGFLSFEGDKLNLSMFFGTSSDTDSFDTNLFSLDKK